MRGSKVLLLLLGVCAACRADAGDGARPGAAGREEQEGSEEAATPVDTTTAHRLSSAFRGAAERALPAVVFVGVEQQGGGAREIPEPLRRYYGLPEGFRMPPMQGSGSGFVFDTAGHVLTNGHVVEGASRVMVRFPDGREFDAQVVGSDLSSDVAVLRVARAGRALPVARMGDSDGVRVGDWVLALGSPLGLDFTVTAGIVSATGRQLSGRASALESFIQTDAAINPGNSGGPLIDLLGRVIAINTAISGGERFVGYGFAVPIDLARAVAEDLLEFGYVRRPQLGAGVDAVSAVDAEAYGLPEVAGAEVRTVEPGSPAAQAGIQAGDVILAVGGQPVRDPAALTTALARHEPGETVQLTIHRGGQRRTVTVRLGEYPRPAATPRPPANPISAERTLGFGVAPLTAQAASRLGVASRQGVFVTEVVPYSSAANAGLRPGQLVRSINGQPVSGLDDIARIDRSIAPGGVVSMRVVDPEAGETVLNFRRGR